jgi:hypothetical protein
MLTERVEEFLRGLGATADEVAESLRRMGVRGVRESGDSCPIANAIRAQFPEAREENGAAWGDDGNGNAGMWFVDLAYASTPEGRISAPDAVHEFIILFDDGIGGDEWFANEYPYADLDDPGVDE